MFLENRSVDFSTPDGQRRLSISGESVIIGDPRRKEAGIYIDNIGYKVGKGDDLDVQLTLGLLDNRLVLYWKETFIYRTYKQGLFVVTGERIEFLCQGIGGIYKSH